MTIDKKTPLEFLQSLGVPLENEHFIIFHNEPENAYDMVLQQPGYKVTDIFLDVLGLIHLIGKNCPDFSLRIGARIQAEKPKIIGSEKPKLIVN